MTLLHVALHSTFVGTYQIKSRHEASVSDPLFILIDCVEVCSLKISVCLLLDTKDTSKTHLSYTLDTSEVHLRYTKKISEVHQRYMRGTSEVNRRYIRSTSKIEYRIFERIFVQVQHQGSLRDCLRIYTLCRYACFSLLSPRICVQFVYMLCQYVCARFTCFASTLNLLVDPTMQVVIFSSWKMHQIHHAHKEWCEEIFQSQHECSSPLNHGSLSNIETIEINRNQDKSNQGHIVYWILQVCPMLKQKKSIEIKTSAIKGT